MNVVSVGRVQAMKQIAVKQSTEYGRILHSIDMHNCKVEMQAVVVSHTVAHLKKCDNHEFPGAPSCMAMFVASYTTKRSITCKAHLVKMLV